MKVLLDEMIDTRFRHLLVGHEVFSVEYMSWKGVKNGALISQAAASGFEALVTVDAGIPKEQNRKSLPLALLIVFSDGSDIDSLRPFAAKVLEKLTIAKIGMIYEIH